MKTFYRMGGAVLVALGSISAAQAALEEITVTAQRRDTNLQSTPIAVTALGAEDLARLNVDMGLDLGAAVPNLQTYQVTSNASAMQVFMRGAGIQNPGFIASESPVGLYVDDVIRSRLATANLDLTDIERIEVLRGPQGTLYGRNSISGAVKVITRTPGEDTWANASVGVGNYETQKFTASAGGEIAPGLGGSFSGLLHERNEGWITRGTVGGRDLGQYDNKAVRGKLNWFGTDNFNATLSAGYVKADNDGFNGIPYGPTPTSSPGAPIQGFYDTLVPDASTGLGETEQFNAALDLSWDIGSMTLNSITGYTDIDDTFRFDLNGGAPANFAPPPVFNIGSQGVLVNSVSNNKAFSQEFTLGGNSFNDQLSWITGLYYLNEEGEQVYSPSAAGTAIDENISTETNSYAVFLEGTWAFTEKLSATLGGRYTRDEKDYINNCVQVSNGFSPFPVCADSTGTPTNWTSDLSENFTEFTPRLLVQYDFTDNVMAYGSLSTGFQAGGFQTLCFGAQSCTDDIYNPQTVDNAEIGSKMDFFDNTVRLNTALFYAKYDDIQQTASTATTAPGAPFPVLNVGKSTVTGLEIEAYWTPIESINTYFIGAWAKDHIDSSAQQNLPSSNKGALPGLPDKTIRIGAEWHPEITSSWAFLVGADVNYVDDYYATINNTALIPSYTRLNGRIGFDQPDGHWSVILTGKNLTDEEDIVSAISGSGTNIRTALPPLEFMLTAAYKY